MRWDDSHWWNFVTTLDAYYTEEDIEQRYEHAGVVCVNVPDKNYRLMEVKTVDLKEMHDVVAMECHLSYVPDAYGYWCYTCGKYHDSKRFNA